MDARAEFTRTVILETFLMLLKEKPVSRITVTELVTKAGINRSTFYKHYLDIPDLLEKTETVLLENLRAMIREQLSFTNDLEYSLAKFLTIIQNEGHRYIPLGSDNGDPSLAAKTFSLLYEEAYPVLAERLPDKTETERHIIFSYLSQGCGGILLWWIQNEMKETPEFIANFILTLSKKIVQ